MNTTNRWKNKPDYEKRTFNLSEDQWNRFTQICLHQGLAPSEHLRSLIAREILEYEKYRPIKKG